MSDNNLISFINIFSENFENKVISKLIVSNINKKSSERCEYKSILFKPLMQKGQLKLSAVYRYPTKDITKNYTSEEVCEILKENLNNSFLQADLYCAEESYHFLCNRNGKSLLNKKILPVKRKIKLQHDKIKTHIIKEGEADFLKLLGVFNADGYLRQDKRDKFKQINKFLEFFAQAIKDSNLTDEFSVIDMGSGKGYLTFAMYDYLKNNLAKNPQVRGVENRQEMVDLCNKMAREADFTELSFEQGTIENSENVDFNVLIALHACDTATDEAIFKGIENKAEIIMVSPCCHKQIRKQMKPIGNLKPLSKFGIIEERLAEMLTDQIRAMILDAYGYTTQIFEFIDSDHTPKNLMIRAVKSKNVDLSKLHAVKMLKAQFGIEFHYLEKLLGIEK